MSDRVRNIIFVSTVLICLGTTLLCVSMFEKTFNSLKAQAIRANEISIAQDFGMEMTRLAQYEASRAHELDQNSQKLGAQFLQQGAAIRNLTTQIEMGTMVSTAQGSYIEQLTECLEANDIEVPIPDLGRAFGEACNDEGCTIPSLQIESMDEDGTIIDVAPLEVEGSE